MRRAFVVPAAAAALVWCLGAAKPVIDNEAHLLLTDQLLGGKVQQLEVRSVRWGPARPGGGASELRMNDTAGGIDAAVETQRKDLVAQDRMGDSASASGHSMLGASDRSPPTRYLTLRPRPYGSGPGTLVVTGDFPGCTVGKRYGGMQFASGGMRYELKDVVTSNCPTAAGPKEEITFVYGTVRVRGWDPKKKEE